jgi:hypothetical protein
MAGTQGSATLAHVGVAWVRVFWWAAASAALMVVDSFGPWARAFVFTVSGVDGDGWFVVGAAAVAGSMLYLYRRHGANARWPLFVALLMGLVGLTVVAVDGKDIFGSQATDDDLFGGVDLVQPGWGIVMAGLASVSLAVAALVLLAMRPREPTHPRLEVPQPFDPRRLADSRVNGASQHAGVRSPR